MTPRTLESVSMHTSDVFSFVAGEPCLDFINTKTGWRKDVWSDLLISFENLVTWQKEAGLLSNREADKLRELGKRRKRKASNALKEAIFFRETAREAVKNLVQGGQVPIDVLEDVNAFLRNSGANRQLEYEKERLVLGWKTDSENMMGKLTWPLAESLITVLTKLPSTRIKQCAGHSCEWFFYDSSKNGQRRWCQMSLCGNRAKAQRFFAKREK